MTASISDRARAHKCGAHCSEARGVVPTEGVYPECVVVEAVRRVEELAAEVAELRDAVATLRAGLGLAPKSSPTNKSTPPASPDFSGS